MTLTESIRQQLSIMAPHQRERYTAKLLEQALAELEAHAMSADKPDKPPYPTQDYSLSLGGVPRETIVLCAGFCLGLAIEPTDTNFNENERELLRQSSKALQAAAMRLFPPP